MATFAPFGALTTSFVILRPSILSAPSAPGIAGGGSSWNFTCTCPPWGLPVPPTCTAYQCFGLTRKLACWSNPAMSSSQKPWLRRGVVSVFGLPNGMIPITESNGPELVTFMTP